MQKINTTHYFKIFNKILIIINLGLVSYMCFLILFKTDERALLLKKIVKAYDHSIERSEETFKQNKPFSYYEAGFNSKDIFQGIRRDKSSHKPQRPKVKPIVVDTTVEDFKRNYKVMGVLLDESPQALIKDVRSKETLFLSIGEKIEKAVLKDIFESKIILEYNDQLIELVP